MGSKIACTIWVDAALALASGVPRGKGPVARFAEIFMPMRLLVCACGDRPQLDARLNAVAANVTRSRPLRCHGHGAGSSRDRIPASPLAEPVVRSSPWAVRLGTRGSTFAVEHYPLNASIPQSRPLDPPPTFTTRTAPCLAGRAQAQSSTHLAVGLLGALCTPDLPAQLDPPHIGSDPPRRH